MPDSFEGRPNPDALLESVLASEPKQAGKLKIFFGYAAGVGKTYAMLSEARDHMMNGVDVLIGYIEPHTRPETMSLLEGLPSMPPKTVQYRNIILKEFDVDEALKRKPDIILVDELAHTNAEGVRNKKRYQDIEELLNAGINVYTTVNVQHLESLNDVVQNITKVQVKETVPDTIFERADMVKLIDIEPEELLKRLSAGKVYRPERAEVAMASFFTKENLRLLREIAIRKAADRISRFNQNDISTTEKMVSPKLLVCVGPSPSSAKCIRWTARTAEAFHAPWSAVYVEGIERGILSEDEKKNIRANLDLAEELGAEIISLNGDDLTTVVADYAKLSGTTNIVVGKSRSKKTLKNVFKPDLEDGLISLLPGVEVHIIPGSQNGISYKSRRRKLAKPTISFSYADTAKTLFYLIAATLFSALFNTFYSGERSIELVCIIMMYILSVLSVSRTTAGFLYGIVASILSVLLFNFFFTVPYYTFTATEPGYPFIFVIMLLVALITSAMTVRVKNQAVLAVEREHRTEVLYEINKKLLVTRDVSKIAALTNEYLVNLFDRSAIFYSGDPSKTDAVLKPSEAEKDSSFLFSEDERAVANWAYLNLKNAGAGTDTLMGAGGFYMPIVAQGKALGVIGLSCQTGKLDQSSRMFLQMIVTQVAISLERQRLSMEQRAIQIESAKEKMRANLLRAISHDLRTPLTSISGASSVLYEGGDRFDEESRKKLLGDIMEESEWLIRMIENILSVTQINENGTNIKKSPEAAEEIIADALNRIRTRFPQRKIRVKVPDELLIVPMDATLIEQVLINLLENAVKHSEDESEISLTVVKTNKDAVFEVSDKGEGIAEQDLPYIFESFSPERKRSPDVSRGMGIGLSICMSIIKAHKGMMYAENKKEGGAVFKFTLPLEEEAKDDK